MSWEHVRDPERLEAVLRGPCRALRHVIETGYIEVVRTRANGNVAVDPGYYVKPGIERGLTLTALSTAEIGVELLTLPSPAQPT